MENDSTISDLVQKGSVALDFFLGALSQMASTLPRVLGECDWLSQENAGFKDASRALIRASASLGELVEDGKVCLQMFNVLVPDAADSRKAVVDLRCREASGVVLSHEEQAKRVLDCLYKLGKCIDEAHGALQRARKAEADYARRLDSTIEGQEISGRADYRDLECAFGEIRNISRRFTHIWAPCSMDFELVLKALESYRALSQDLPVDDKAEQASALDTKSGVSLMAPGDFSALDIPEQAAELANAIAQLRDCLTSANSSADGSNASKNLVSGNMSLSEVLMRAYTNLQGLEIAINGLKDSSAARNFPKSF